MSYLVAYCLLLASVLCTTGCKPGYQRDTAAFLAEMQQNVPPVQLQQWAQQEIATANGQLVVISNVPAFVGSTSHCMPTYARVIPNNGSPYVHLVWGGGFGYWGLKAGAPTFTATSGPNDYYVNWVSGIYAWHEIQ